MISDLIHVFANLSIFTPEIINGRNEIFLIRERRYEKRVHSWYTRVYHEHGTPKGIFVINQNFRCSFDTKFAHMGILLIYSFAHFAHFVIKVFAQILKWVEMFAHLFIFLICSFAHFAHLEKIALGVPWAWYTQHPGVL